ncbi:ABC transporter ATP-binding protein [Alkalibacterium iburiense]|uniref:ABC transporter ATP-binding protein n=1 Tax=Alkalibacterium iburiense TaxID=290589 RepID=A0ABN0XBI1_9LACT
MTILEVTNVSKSFGSQKVLDGISFSVPKGSVYGFIGKNGAGKTTTMNIALGLLKADEGEITIQGQTVRYGETETNKLVGYLPDVPEFYPFLTAREYLKLCADISGMDAKEAKQKITELLEMVGLDDSKKRIKTYSRGMKQRLGIAQALINDPVLLICDEPTSALDPVGRKQLLSILRKVKDKTTVIFSTHILSDVESICDEVAILNNGKIVTQGTLSELKSQVTSEKIAVLFEKETDASHIREIWESLSIFSEIEHSTLLLEGTTTDTKQAMALTLDWLTKESITPKKIETKEASMDDVFLEAIK